jgi:hypothetical protein
VNKRGRVAIDTFCEREREEMLSRSEIGVMDTLWKRNENDQHGVTESG